MQYLFSPEGEVALNTALVMRPVIVFDFDGTLAPIVAQPDNAKAPAAVVEALTRLSALMPTAVLSGRGIDDLRPRLGFEPRYLVGNHGAEGDALALLPEWAGVVSQWRSQLAGMLTALPTGVLIEDKTWSLSLHYRLTQDHDLALRAIEEVVAELDPPPVQIGGKCVLNLLAPGAPDKFDALASIVARDNAGTAIFIGDDETDESVFRKAPAHWLTVRVERNESSAATWFIHQQEEMLRFIQTLEQSARDLAGGQPA